MTYQTDTSLPPREQVRAALRSGEFKQARESLQDGDGYCCHGVACVVAEQNGVRVKRDFTGELAGVVLSHGQEAVLGWLDMSRDEESERIGWNDEDEMTFDQIAEWY